MGPIVSHLQLERDLRTLGITAGDMVMVHASLRSIGPIDGRAEALVQAMLNVLAPEGTLIAYVDYQSSKERRYFDPKHSPAIAEYGVFPEIVRQWPGAVRSLNPGASVAAIGARAHWLCRDHSLNYGYGEQSPLAKLVEAYGKVLLLGSDLDHVTLLHYAEHIARLSNKRVVKVPTKILSQGKVMEIVVEEFDTGRPILDDMPEQYFKQIVQSFIQAGYALSGLVGNAPSYVLPAEECVKFAVEKMEKEFGT